ncbi:MAG TPA: FAD-dependent oxidoreductase [Geobacteraceae bacterium]
MNYVIIGNSVAAVGAIRGIRSVDPQGNITVISRERHTAYGRPLISYLLGGLITEKRMPYLPEDFYEQNRVNLLLNSEVVAVDSAKKQVQLAGGEAVPYERLLIATGGDPFVPPMEGLADKEKVFTFTTWDDAAKLKGLSADIDRVVVVGGGLIGLKAAEGLHLLGKKVTIVELADRILSAAFDRPAGRIVAKKMKANGIEVITEDTVIRVEGEGAEISGVTLKSGDFIPCDTLVVAIGVRPAAGFLKGSKVEVNRGVVVDDSMATSVKGIFAAGDVAEARDFFSGAKNPMPIWPDAYIQGDIAGTAMAGGSKSYAGGLAMNSIEFFKVSTISMGVTNPPDPAEYEVLTYLDAENYQYRKIVLKDNLLVGAVLVGNVDRAGIFAGLIRERVDVTPFRDKLLAADFGFIHLTKEIRNALFAPVGKVA